VKITDDELLEIIDEVTTTLGQLLLTHRELTEGLLDQNQTIRSQQRINALKKGLDMEKERLAQTRRSQQRKKELERIRQDHERESSKDTQTEQKNGTVPVINQKGQVVGRIQTVGRNRVNILDPTGRVVGREINGVTYDRRGQVRGTGSQGLRILGISQRR
jgi:hypothetical protein